MTEQERKNVETDLELLKYLLQFHNEQEENLGMSHAESIEHRLNMMEEIEFLNCFNKMTKVSQKKNKMDNQLEADLATYRNLSSEEDKKFLNKLQMAISQMTPEQRKQHKQAILDKIRTIQQYIEGVHQPS